MAASLFPLLFVFLIHPLSSTANIHKTNNLLKSHLFTEPTSITTTRPAHKPLNDTPPTVFFEVTKPIDVPNTKPCKHFILQHDFASTYGKPPVLLNYTPPSHCPSQDFSKIVLEWEATCKGRQFDRIFGVWLGGVELLRSCTAEPRATGIVWTVRKDITRFISSNGWVKSSHGNITTRFNQHFGYSNLMEMGKDGDLQIVNQTIKFTDNVSFRKPSSNVKAFKSLKNFEFDMYSDYMDQGNGTSLSVANVTLGFNEKNVKHAGLGFASNILRNLQNGQGVMVVKNNLVQSGMGSTQQEYTYNVKGIILI